VGNVLLYTRYREDIEHKVGHCYNGCIKLLKYECNDMHNCIRKTIMNGDACQPRIYVFLLSGEIDGP